MELKKTKKVGNYKDTENREKFGGVIMKYFKESEFECKCGCGANNMQEEMLRRLGNARQFTNTPFSLNSACRCEKHNKAAGSKPTSSHVTGWAVDIKARDSVSRYKILGGLMKAGFNRIGIADTFIRADCDPKKSECVIWTY